MSQAVVILEAVSWWFRVSRLADLGVEPCVADALPCTPIVSCFKSSHEKIPEDLRSSGILRNVRLSAIDVLSVLLGDDQRIADLHERAAAEQIAELMTRAMRPIRLMPRFAGAASVPETVLESI